MNEIELQVLKVQLYQVFSSGAEQHHEPQSENMSQFENDLLEFLGQNQVKSVDSLRQIIESNLFDSYLICNALSIVGEVDNDGTYDERRRLLTDYLFHKSTRIRLGAITGLSMMDDAITVSYLRHALSEETNDMLRKTIKQILEHQSSLK